MSAIGRLVFNWMCIANLNINAISFSLVTNIHITLHLYEFFNERFVGRPHKWICRWPHMTDCIFCRWNKKKLLFDSWKLMKAVKITTKILFYWFVVLELFGSIKLNSILHQVTGRFMCDKQEFQLCEWSKSNVVIAVPPSTSSDININVQLFGKRITLGKTFIRLFCCK